MEDWKSNVQANNKLVLFQGDITRVAVDAIVNAANSSLLGGGGVDGAIHRAGGPEILAACKKIREQQGPCPPGEAVITTAGKLPAKYVIHTVGPIWQGGEANEPETLANCYRNSLKLALAYDCKTVAFPNISTGVYGYPKEKAATIAVNTATSFLNNNNGLEHVVFVVFAAENYRLYNHFLKQD